MNLLICSEGSEQASRAARLGATIAVGCQAKVTLLGITEHSADAKPLLESLEKGQKLLLEKKVETELILKHGAPIEEIIKTTEQAAFDLVIIGAVRKDMQGLFWMSSKTYKIIKSIRPPVLSVSGRCNQVKKVLISSGGKPYIDDAVKLSSAIASGTGASITLLHVMPSVPPIYNQWPRMEEAVEWVLESQSELGVNLKRERDMIVSAGVPAEVKLRKGGVISEILKEIREGQYDLVVVGSTPQARLRTYMLGDIAREIINRAECAVLVGRSEYAFGPARMLKSFIDHLLHREKTPAR